MRNIRNAYKVLVGTAEGRDLGVGGMIILK
jgi:hypothetical protein